MPQVCRLAHEGHFLFGFILRAADTHGRLLNRLIYMAKDETILRFDKVSFEYEPNKPLLEEVSFPLRRGSKITIMGQNGAGKTTLFRLFAGTLKPESGIIHREQGLTIATAKQVVDRDSLNLTIREYFQKCFINKVYDIDPRIDEVLEVVNLKGHNKLHDRILKTFSGDNWLEYYSLRL